MNGNNYTFLYRMLCSVDLIDSTLYKSRPETSTSDWAYVFESFFDEFPTKVRWAFDSICADIPNEYRPARCLQIWKLVGDEILFEAELARYEDVAVHLVSLKRALDSYSPELAAKTPLALKATVWGAGFPVLNREVRVPTGHEQLDVRDYLGPSIDLGFRLCSWADRRRIPVSADIVWMLLRSQQAMPGLHKEIHVFLERTEVLKGVCGGKPYPVFWVDRLNATQTPEDKLLRREWTFNSRDVQEYLTDLFQRNANYLRQPFIQNDPAPDMSLIPQDTQDLLTKLKRQDTERSYGESARATDPPKPVAGPDVSTLPSTGNS